MTTVVSATTEPTDRSMPPDTMTIVMPSAAVQTIAVCRAMSSRLAPLKKRGPISDTEDDRDEQQADERSRRFEQPAGAHAACSAPVASIISWCSVSPAAARVLVRGGRDA